MRPGIKREQAERLLANVVIEDGCWVYQGSLDAYGYADLRGWLAGGRPHFKGHRVAWELENGPIPEGMVVMHTCDNPACVWVGHLRLGTQQENLADCRAKGRARGRFSAPVMEGEPV